MDFFPKTDLDGAAAEAMARGLLAVARVDGLHEREAGLIASFWMETGVGHGLLSDLERAAPITAEELATSLHTPEQRKMFMKTATLLTWADGKVTDEEKTILAQFGDALGIDATTRRALDEEVRLYLLNHVSHLQNSEAAVKVAQKLGL